MSELAGAGTNGARSKSSAARSFTEPADAFHASAPTAQRTQEHSSYKAEVWVGFVVRRGLSELKKA